MCYCFFNLLGSFAKIRDISSGVISTCVRMSFNKMNINEPRHDKTNKVTVRPAKTQISLGIRCSLCAEWVAKDPSFLHADSEDSDQTGRMPRLI